MRFGVLGPLQVVTGDVDTARPVSAPRLRAVLAVLLWRPNQPVSFDELADLVWDGRPPSGAREAVRALVMRLRRHLDPLAAARIVTRAPGYTVEVSGDELDASRAATLTREADAAVRGARWPDASRAATGALSLWRGTPLIDVPSELLRDQWTPVLEQLHLQAMTSRIEADLHQGRHEQLIPELRELTARHPLRESFHQQLMLALAHSGRRAEALDAYHVARRTLAAELGVDPSPELHRLQERVREGDVGLTAPPGMEEEAETLRKPAAPVLLMRELSHSGRQAEALALYHRVRSRLVDELGVEPGQELRDAHQEVLALDGEPDISPHAVASSSGARATVPHQLPPTVEHFTGRQVELDVLTKQAMSSVAATVVISAIDGMAGVGKTALAVHWAHRHVEHFPDGQLYIDLRGFDPVGPPVETGAAIRRFLDALGVPPGAVPADLDAQIDLYRTTMADRRMLVVLDNAVDADHVRSLLPGTAECVVLVTSRNQLSDLVAVDGAHPVSLDVLADDEARELLRRRLGGERVTREPAAADRLTALCARLPLALNIAAAHAAGRPGWPLDAVADALDRTGRRLDALSIGSGTANLRAVFSWSYRALDDDAARVFRLLAVHPGPDISIAATASLAAVPRDRAGAALAELTRANLLTEHVPERWACHDLLRAYATEQSGDQDTDEARRDAFARVLDHYLHTAVAADRLLEPTRDPITIPPARPGVAAEPLATIEQALRWYDAEQPVLAVMATLAATAGFDRHAWQIPWALADFFQRRGHWHDQIDAQQVALAAAHRLADQTAQAYAHRVLGRAYTRLGRYQDAVAQLRCALDSYERIGDVIGQAYVHRGLVWVLDRQDRVDEALPHAERALELCREAGHRMGQIFALNALGWLHTRHGDADRALAACEHALELARLTGDVPAEASIWESIGYARHHLGRYDEAVACYERALAGFRASGERYFEADTLSHLGDTYEARGEPGASRRVWRQALGIFEELRHHDADGVREKLAGQ